MSLFSGARQPTSRRPRAPLWTGLAALVVLAIGVSLLPRRQRPVPVPQPGRPPVARPTPAPAPRPEPTPEAGRRARVVTAPAAEAPRAPRLRITADVPGASVFVDHHHVGTAPVEVDDLTPGPHRINVSADGYEMYGETVEVADTPKEVAVRFKEVRLDESLAVVHRHAMGSCSGRLAATIAGLAYETDRTEDAFSTGFDRLEPLSVDYLKKNLRVRLRGGRTYNFTAPEGEADALLVFEKKVEAARRRLAGGS